MAGDGSGSSGGLAAPEVNPSDLNIILSIFGTPRPAAQKPCMLSRFGISYLADA